jgi:VIT1/CCC1 family predicted Fe2+/Mn2+ transporter
MEPWPVSEHTQLVNEHDEPHDESIGSRLNGLRAAVLGANDGIVSTAGLVIGVAAATTERSTILTAGLAGLAAGAMSMAVGEYVSVSTQRDTEQSLLAKERRELREEPETELDELTELYADRGLSPDLAREVAVQLTAHDALGAHAEVELGIDPNALTSPWHAAWASLVAFTVGALVPLIAIVLATVSIRVPVTVIAVVLSLFGTGWLSARLGSAPVGPAVRRVIFGGVLAMAVTYGIGSFVGTQV